MLLIDEDDTLYVNEQARERLQSIWGQAYIPNMKRIIPKMSQDLDAGFLFSAGVKVVAQDKQPYKTHNEQAA